ncbi:hypothetical protein TOPH_02970 [Tolypocladium ophioglossoides CBS 100239]|uniref:SUN domain-containing protein n=1 Tax=Tolypocladium ophioglossoides (strain CBS 100239) TaxID=1163406 RepID=A0A0L0NE11_TOLOC|nr:hypothetical protein TOPH_02970 [Tolypocladium ophioglossoides CBS 100239]
MPPTVAGRRRAARVASHEPDNTPSSRSGFQKPNLPPLQGTPSSRRQYAYGAAAEPVPSRPGRGLQRGQVLDLSTAVRSALVRHDEEEEHDDGAAAAQAPPQSVDPDEDELAANVGTAARGPMQVIRNMFNLGGQGPDGSEADDARSFGMESDYYVDATIGSTPGSMPPPSTRRTTAKVDAVSASPKTPQPTVPTTRASKPRPTKPVVENPPPRQRGRAAQEEAEAAESEDDQTVKPIKLRHDISTNAPAPRRGQAGARGNSRARRTRAAPASRLESEGRTHQESASAATEEQQSTRQRRGRQAAGKQSAGASNARRGGLEEDDSGDESGSESGRWASGATRATATNRLFANRPPLLPNLTTNHTAAQRNTAAGEPGQGEREQETENGPDVPQHRWAWLGSLVSPLLRRRDQDDETDDELEEAPAINWWQLLNPWTYVKATAWIVVAIWGWLAGVFVSLFPSGTRQFTTHALREVPYVLASIVSLVLALALMSAAYTSSRYAAADDIWDPAARGSSWPALGDIKGKIGGYMPRLSWPSSSWGDDLTWEMDDDATHAKLDDYLRKTKQAFQSLEEAGRLHDGALKKLEAVVPKVVHMQLKDGKPVVAPEFYHALRDLIHEDDAVLTFARTGSEYDVTSERQWKAIAARLMKDPTFTSKLNLTVGEAEDRLGSRVTGFWQTWVRQNEARMQQAIGAAVDQIKSAGSQREFDERLGKVLQAQLRDSERQGLLVSRDEFLRHLNSEVAALRAEIRAELSELQPRLERLVRESVHLATRDLPPGMSRAEVTSLVNGLVRRAFADVNLEAVAQGKIHAHWDAELKHQVNYFSVGAGATIDARHSSATYDPFHRRFYAPGAHRTGLRKALPPIAALEPWADAGDCWCAARAVNRRRNPHGAALSVQLAHRVVPQHVVVEHILPGATTDPGARPRDVEVYAVIAERAVRERVRDFAAAAFPGPEPADDWDHTPADLPEQFALIGRFVYEGAALHDGVHVHRLSSELVALGADTDQVVVRATSNYGAANHTCFYRVRLYGHNVEMDGPRAEGAEEWQ